jgi:hypothetical protein
MQSVAIKHETQDWEIENIKLWQEIKQKAYYE